MLSCGSDDDANGGGHATGGPDYYSEHLRSTVLELQGRHIQEQVRACRFGLLRRS